MLRVAVAACSLLVGCSFDPGGQGAIPDAASTGDGATGFDAGCSAQTYDAFDQFSFSSNPTPDGMWRYGSTAGFLGAFTSYPQQSVDGQGLQAWHTDIGPDPNVVINPTGTEVLHALFPIVFPADDFLHVHPGPSDQPSMVRWTAPADGTYVVDAAFSSLNTTGATTGVHIVHNDVVLFEDDITSAEDTASYTMTHSLVTGDILDFAVTDGGNYISDSTGVKATITSVCAETGI